LIKPFLVNNKNAIYGVKIHKIVINCFFQPLDRFLEKKNELVIYGPRRVGKTTLVNHFLTGTRLKYKLDSGNEWTRNYPDSQVELISSQNYWSFIL